MGRSIGVLVVDDNQPFLAMLGEGLRPYGLKVWLAAGAREALRIYQQNRAHIGTVLLDVSMPDLDGPETFGLLRKIDPALVCCFMNGISSPYTERELLALGGHGVLKKPFLLTEVYQFVRSMARNDLERTA
jgi:CheY-like chemotaxis protein